MNTSQTACSTRVSTSSGRNTAQIMRNIFSFRTLGALLSQIQLQAGHLIWSWGIMRGGNILVKIRADKPRTFMNLKTLLIVDT